MHILGFCDIINLVIEKIGDRTIAANDNRNNRNNNKNQAIMNERIRAKEVRLIE